VKSEPTRGKRDSTPSHDADEFSFSGIALFAEKDEYLEKGLIFTIKAIEYQETAGFEGAPRWAITVAPSDGRPDEIITLQANEKRDQQLQAAEKHIAARGPIHNVRLAKRGKAFYFDTVAEAKKTA